MPSPARARRTLLLLLVAGFWLIPSAVAGGVPTGPGLPPVGSISSNLEFVTNIPSEATAISMHLVDYPAGQRVLFVSSTTGLRSYDVTDPAAPRLLGAVVEPIWENEDMDVDVRRKLVIISRDPRVAIVDPVKAKPTSGVQLFDASNPGLLLPLTFIPLPVGHTAACINECDYLWVNGPYGRPILLPGEPDPGNAQPRGRPVIAVDIRDPRHPVLSPVPIDTNRNDGVTDYVHDVHVDAAGVAWTSGAGGVRGYWTSGRHRDPVTGQTRTATGFAPVPYAGGKISGDLFSHNSFRPDAQRYRPRDPSKPGYRDPAPRPGEVVLATEETFAGGCAADGKLRTVDLKGRLVHGRWDGFDGKSWKVKPGHSYDLPVLDSWEAAGEQGSRATSDCSAHWFDYRQGLVAEAFYSQGVRLLDVSDPLHIKQIGWWVPDQGQAWAAYWNGPYLYVADFQRGLDVLRFTGSAGPNNRDLAGPTVAASPIATVLPHGLWGYACRLEGGPASPAEG
ncbi:MAG TPA: hypothetical protein VKA30_11595 [Actinomycetota bacterium]|nr:hypothetical protein [Actinomycetota bacterium]